MANCGGSRFRISAAKLCRVTVQEVDPIRRLNLDLPEVLPWETPHVCCVASKIKNESPHQMRWGFCFRVGGWVTYTTEEEEKVVEEVEENPITFIYLCTNERVSCPVPASLLSLSHPSKQPRPEIDFQAFITKPE